MTFTIEQLEALKEGTTPAPWKPQHDTYATMWVDCSNICDDTDGKDADLAFLAPELLDALIAEKQTHAELRKRIEERIRELKQPLCSHMPDGDELDDYLEQWYRQSYEAEMLTQILEGNE